MNSKPQGFFKDHEGNVHPIYEPNGERTPSRSHAEWMSKITDEEKQAVHDWTLGANNKWFKQTAKKRPQEVLDNGSYAQIDAFHRAIAKAPVVGADDPHAPKPTLFRGIHDISNKAFNDIVNSKTLTATSPASFSPDGLWARKWFGSTRDTKKNSIVFRMEDHNAADIHLAAAKRYIPEGEAVVPQGSRYKVDRVEVSPIRTRSGENGGQHAEIHLSLDRSDSLPDKKPISFSNSSGLSPWVYDVDKYALREMRGKDD